MDFPPVSTTILPRAFSECSSEVLLYAILRGLDRPRFAALRLAARCGRQSLGVGDAANVAGEGWPPSEACGKDRDA